MHGPLILERLLGTGATGTVYLACHPPSGARFAVRVLHPHLASNPHVRSRFYVEANVASRVVHRHIARVLDARPGPGGLPCLLMEYVSGEPLSCLPLPLSPAETVGLLSQVLEGLEVAHARGVVHCDLKPDNLFLTQDARGQRRVKVLDFGMASVLASGFSKKELASGMSLGSPAYMAPEQWETTAADVRVDVYALAVLGYRLLTGRLPYGRGRMGEVLLGQQEIRPPAPHVLDPRVPQALSVVVMQALSRRPEERFPSARAFRFALEESVRNAPKEAVTLEAAAPRAAAPSGLRVRVGCLGSPEPRVVRASDVSAEGLFIAFDGPPPPLASRLPMELSFQGQAVICAGDVVRHVSQDEAHAWGVSAGFFVHFAEPSRALRTLISHTRAGPAEPPADAELAQLLSRTAALGRDPYMLLGLPPSASFDEVRQRADSALRRLEGFWRRTLPTSQRQELETLRAHVESARRTLGEPLARVGFDALRGNPHGIARCIAMGLTDREVEPLRRAYLSARPGTEERARAFFSQGRTLETQNSAKAAVECYAQALALDPLNLTWQRHYWALQRRLRPMTTTVPTVSP
ncbi:serine/threonine-protein kinase [Hyalangium rubrum]|uniref:Serine/threonine-protein kinase n=1 Tax=Hyalangium rubrum TaxID=3103134 RepID=A0ABU5H2F7_9BACT|nr:serine/threonine-protein kinase [Hyalangium sp. s54d21]MDY7227501.1 serine/threonine-protein kinase [Hyalangium sp. s54d21]